METFSWTDTARAVFASCLPCLPSSRRTDSVRENEHITRRDELEGLLAGADLTDDADALSLHSHIGQQDGRKRIKKKKKRHTKNKGSISLFGYDLFGRPLQSQEHAEDDNERGINGRISRISSSTLDSDATPLADDAIAELSTRPPEQHTADEAHRTRKHRLRQHKIATLLDTHGDSFEGFPGSGVMQHPAADDFGAFQHAPAHAHAQPDPEFVQVQGGGADEADAEADFDASSYVRSAPERSESGSGTRSRTSTSSSRPQPHHVPLPPSSASSTTPAFQSPAPVPVLAPAPKPKPKRSKKAKSGKRSPATLSSATASQPRSPTSTAPAPHVEIASPHDVAFEGVPVDSQDVELPLSASRLAEFPSQGLGRSNGFPSSGLGRSGLGFPSAGLGDRKNRSMLGSQGSFLARTGEDA